MEIQTQNEYIYEWLLAGNSITTLDAMLHHHIGRLASRICDLVNDYAVPIQKEREPNKERQGLPYAQRGTAVQKKVPCLWCYTRY